MANDRCFVLDSSALLALRSDESGADQVERLPRGAEARDCRLLASFMTQMESIYLIWREEREVAARDTLRPVGTYRIDRVSCADEILQLAGSLNTRAHCLWQTAKSERQLWRERRFGFTRIRSSSRSARFVSIRSASTWSCLASRGDALGVEMLAMVHLGLTGIRRGVYI